MRRLLSMLCRPWTWWVMWWEHGVTPWQYERDRRFVRAHVAAMLELRRQCAEYKERG